MTIAEAQRDDPDLSTSGSSGPTSIRAAIAFARRGIYPAGAVQDVPTALRSRYFIRSGTGFDVVKRLRAEVVFGEHDLSARVPFPRIDLLLCRNVLIYFTPRLQRAALETFAFSLRTGGGPGPRPVRVRDGITRRRMLRTTRGCGSTDGCPVIERSRTRGRRWFTRLENPPPV